MGQCSLSHWPHFLFHLWRGQSGFVWIMCAPLLTGLSCRPSQVGSSVIQHHSLFGELVCRRHLEASCEHHGNVQRVQYDVYRPTRRRRSAPSPTREDFTADKNNVAPRLDHRRPGRQSCMPVSGIFFDPFQTDLHRRALLNNGTPLFLAHSGERGYGGL